MTEAELKKIHGDNVELGEDDSEDEKLTEKKALAQAKKEGLVPQDIWVVADENLVELSVHDDKAKAEAALEKGQILVQRRNMLEAN